MTQESRLELETGSFESSHLSQSEPSAQLWQTLALEIRNLRKGQLVSPPVLTAYYQASVVPVFQPVQTVTQRERERLGSYRKWPIFSPESVQWRTLPPRSSFRWPDEARSKRPFHVVLELLLLVSDSVMRHMRLRQAELLTTSRAMEDIQYNLSGTFSSESNLGA